MTLVGKVGSVERTLTGTEETDLRATATGLRELRVGWNRA